MAYIGETLEASARQSPAGAALKCASTMMTWDVLLKAVQKIEAAIVEKTQPDARVALLLSDPAAVLVCFFACARSGRIAMVMDLTWPKSRIQDVCAATNPALLIDGETYQTVMKSPGEPNLARTGGAPSGKSDFYAGFTSGSTGLPKGYVRSHRSWLESFRLSDADFAARQPRRVIIPGGVSHSLHLYGAVHSLNFGTPVTLLPHFDPRTVLAEMQADDGGSALYATPTQLQLIEEAAHRHGPMETVLLVFCSGAKWSEDGRTSISRVFPEARLVEFYGASETSFISFSRSGDGTPSGSAGRPAPGVDVAIGEPAHPVPEGVSGPVWVKSHLLFSGYICGSAPDTCWRDGWLTFGDHGYLDGNGFLFLSGRENRMVITSGLNVYPEEIETALLRHPAVSNAVVLGVADPLRGERLEAVIELRTDIDDPQQALLEFCRAAVGTAKCPKRFHITAQMPLTVGGKPDIQALEHIYNPVKPKISPPMESQSH